MIVLSLCFSLLRSWDWLLKISNLEVCDCTIITIINCAGYLVQNISNSLFEELIKHVMDNLVNPTKVLQSYITCINVIRYYSFRVFMFPAVCILSVLSSNISAFSGLLINDLLSFLSENCKFHSEYSVILITTHTLSRHAGHRFGNKLKIIVPKVAEFAHSAGENDDLRESAIQVSR